MKRNPQIYNDLEGLTVLIIYLCEIYLAIYFDHHKWVIYLPSMQLDYIATT